MTASTTTTSTPATDAPKVMPTRATWKQHGRPTKGFEFFGTEIKTPATKGRKVAKVDADSTAVVLWAAGNKQIDSFGVATKFWAIVPEDAPRQAEPAKADPKTPAEKLAPVVITAAKGGDTTVAPKKGAIAKAIKASGKSIMAISREHGLNPSQMRRLSLDTVAKVDTVRAELIAKALGVKLADLFDAPETKAKSVVKPPKAATTDEPATPATHPAVDEAAEQAEALAAQAAAEASQDEPTSPCPAEDEANSTTPAAE